MSERIATEGIELFRAFLVDNELSARAAAEALGVSHVAVSAWVRLVSRPDAHMREAIAVWTRGRVPIESWLQDDERERIEGMRAFVPKPKPATDEPEPEPESEPKPKAGPKAESKAAS